MGAVKIDTTKRALAYEQEFDLGTADGVLRFLRRIHDIRSRRDNGDLDAATLLIDFMKSWEEAPLTLREREVLYYLYEQMLTRKETAKVLGISVQAVCEFQQNAAQKIAELLEGYNNV